MSIYVWNSEPKEIYVWTTPVKEVYVWTTKVRPSTMPAWIYHNATLGLISLSSDWENWLTIADKNLGATQVWNSWDTLSEANCGKFYQRWNNYGFPRSGATSVYQNSNVNASTYWPNNYYSNRRFRWWTNTVYWDTSKNNNLWWWTTDTYTARKWPCDVWWHIPSYNDLIFVSNIAWNSKTDTPARLKLPPAWELERYDWTLSNNWTRYFMWSSDWVSWWERWVYWSIWYTISPPSWTEGSPKKYWYSIRPFKNEAVQPDSSRTKLY